MVAEICFVRHLAKRILVENALIPIFVLGAKWGGLQHFKLWAYSGPNIH